jgi:hypothetical protein
MKVPTCPTCPTFFLLDAREKRDREKVGYGICTMWWQVSNRKQVGTVGQVGTFIGKSRFLPLTQR